MVATNEPKKHAKEISISAFPHCFTPTHILDLNQRTHEKSQINERFIYDNKPPTKMRLIIGALET